MTLDGSIFGGTIESAADEWRGARPQGSPRASLVPAPAPARASAAGNGGRCAAAPDDLHLARAERVDATASEHGSLSAWALPEGGDCETLACFVNCRRRAPRQRMDELRGMPRISETSTGIEPGLPRSLLKTYANATKSHRVGEWLLECMGDLNPRKLTWTRARLMRRCQRDEGFKFFAEILLHQRCASWARSGVLTNTSSSFI